MQQSKKESLTHSPTTSKVTIPFDDKHRNPADSQLLLAVTGTPAFIKETLERLLKDIKEHGKPIQGIGLSDGNIHEVKTPLWNNQRY